MNERRLPNHELIESDLTYLIIVNKVLNCRNQLCNRYVIFCKFERCYIGSEVFLSLRVQL